MLCTQEKGGLFFHSEAAHAPHLDPALTAIVCKHKGAKHSEARTTTQPTSSKFLKRSEGATNFISTTTLYDITRDFAGSAEPREYRRVVLRALGCEAHADVALCFAARSAGALVEVWVAGRPE